MSDIQLPEKFAFVDLETTGGRVTYDRIIEVGILRVENGELVETYQTLVNPEMFLSPFIQNMTNILPEELEAAPTFSQVKRDIYELLEDCVFVAHNVRFDYGFLRQEFKREDISFSSKHFCTAKLSKYLYPDYRKHNLDALIERFGFSCQSRHRAFDDAKVLWDFYTLLKQNIPHETFTQAIHYVMRSPSIPLNLPLQDLEALPETSGVYIFYGENQMPLYVGKSKNIKDRVLSHFANDHLSTKEMKMCQQTHHIKTITTAGELGALIKESYLIKTLQPVYNRVLRNAYGMILLKKYEDEAGYMRVALEAVDTIDPKEMESVITVFKSKKRAKHALSEIAKSHRLCLKLLDLEKTDRACFNYHLKQCDGACINLEDPIRYNLKFISAFSSCKIPAWPFRGPIKIRETNELNGKLEEFIIDKWCLVGKKENGESLTNPEYYFDWDTYKILSRYLRNGVNRKTISTLTEADTAAYFSQSPTI